MQYQAAGIEVIGNDNFGDKARQLIEKTPKVREIGFHTPRRTVLAQDAFDGYLQRMGYEGGLDAVVASTDLETKIKNGSLSRQELELLKRVYNIYGKVPMAVRSSAAGDSRGTGTYRTEFTNGGVLNLGRALKHVWSSYFSPDAIAFRGSVINLMDFMIFILLSKFVDKTRFRGL